MKTRRLSFFSVLGIVLIPYVFYLVQYAPSAPSASSSTAIDYLAPLSVVDNSIWIQSMDTQPSSQVPLVMISLWFGQEPPNYVHQFLASVRRNRNITLLIPATFESNFFCPPDSPPQRIEGNILIACMKKQDMILLFARKMCGVWECILDDLRDFHNQLILFLKDPYAITEFKPMYATVFEDYIINWPNRTVPFSHWMRIDMDMIVGDFEAMFPWELLNTFDVIALKTPEWQTLWFPGASTVYRLREDVNKIWTHVWGLQSSFSFKTVFMKKPDIGQAKSPYGATDEGAHSKAIILSGSITWIKITMYLQWLTTFNFYGEEAHVVVKGGNERKILTVPKHLSDKEASQLFETPITHTDLFNITLSYGQEYLEFTCPSELYYDWPVPSGRLCIQSRDGRPPDPPKTIQLLFRNRSYGPILRAAVPDLRLRTREIIRDNGQKETVDFMTIPLLHLWQAKRDKMKFLDRGLAEGETMNMYQKTMQVIKGV